MLSVFYLALRSVRFAYRRPDGFGSDRCDGDHGVFGDQRRLDLPVAQLTMTTVFIWIVLSLVSESESSIEIGYIDDAAIFDHVQVLGSISFDRRRVKLQWNVVSSCIHPSFDPATGLYGTIT